MATSRPMPTAGLKPMPETIRKVWLGTNRDLDDQSQDDFNHVPPNLKFLRRTANRTALGNGFAEGAVRHLERLPAVGESMHLILDGRFPLWAFVPATLALAGCPIAEMQLATLGFSRDNVAELCQMIDAGNVGAVHILCSHYFKHASADIYEPAATVLAERGQRIHAVRTHCKIINARFADGRTVTIESSANMRSCKNIEQAVACSDPGLYDFHRAWMLALFPEIR